MIRCSSIVKLMVPPKSNNKEWSQTAITAMTEMARDLLFGVRKQLDDVNAIRKGRMCENLGIDLYNDVFMYNLVKVDSSQRRNNGIITGEPDLLAVGSNKGVDIKIAWSLLTFPLSEAEVISKGYEWQARGYMCLFDMPAWEIAYCAIDTPTELLREWDDMSIHKIDSSIPLHHRITVARYERDLALEKEMLEKCAKANDYIEKTVKAFVKDHDKYIE